ncbi:recombinase family protein [Clostridium botulinum]|uniref:recombinase family protein n=1 Tax=Clostridium botulinum TaxID=1491 RepID=UPI0004DA376B|nr:recombinase family protein [Clostridium botulinum]KEI03001.1 serine recombinase [Clostridium botulinum C/D str. BKT75002]KEI07385.1 serine recombinase [Clostridium botulinum C/D str. BKT2873]QPW59765.1 recombinase family protein [Clostridium botulinum]QPW62290.1 recombinase family protein [Clostridium phage CWou-2020b]
MPKVSVIPAKPVQVIKGMSKETKKRVCAYCRVSTDSDEQLTSYEAQVTYYEEYIKSKPEYEFCGIFADEGISGTNTKKRTQFNKMIEEALAGKFDMIITKSISRFSRNTLDTLKYIRILKEKGIGVYFEKEHIDTLDSKGEVLITILSSLAQDESRNISENSRWGIVRRFQQGKIRVNHKRFLGYDKDLEGNLIINKQQAKVVRRIYEEYLEGKGIKAIAKGLEKDKILTGAGKSKWYDSTLQKILRNEKYTGDALLQKTITTDFLTHKRVKNRGEVQQYFVEDSHPAIISKETFQRVQEEIKRRANLVGYSEKTKSRYTHKYAFSGKIICGNCGSKLRRKRWGPGEKYKKYVWLCANHIDNGVKACNMKAVSEEKLKAAFVKSINKIINNKEDFIKKLMKNVNMVLENKEDETEVKAINEKLEQLKEQMMNLVRLNVRSSLDNQIYDEEYQRLEEEMQKLKEKKAKFDNTDLIREKGLQKVKEIKKVLAGREDIIKKFDDELFTQIVKQVKVISLVEVEFVYKSGAKIKEIL